MDLVPCHTSIEHPWFRERPDFYVWADEPNNWRSAFGGPAWSRRGERWYLHSFYPEQADLDWRNPDVVAAMQEVVRFWLDRGVDGYRVDAIDRLLKDPELRDDPPADASPSACRVPEDNAALALTNSRNAPDIGTALAAIREAAGDALLVGEVYLPSRAAGAVPRAPGLVFSFELLHARWDAAELGAAIAGMPAGRAAWVMSNHDFGRLATRYGARERRRGGAAPAHAPGAVVPVPGRRDRAGGGTGRPSRPLRPRPLPPSDAVGLLARRVASRPASRGCRSSIPSRATSRTPDSQSRARGDRAARPGWARSSRWSRPTTSSCCCARGDHLVAVNTGDRPRPLPGGGDPVLESEPGAAAGGRLAAHGGAVLRLALDVRLDRGQDLLLVSRLVEGRRRDRLAVQLADRGGVTRLDLHDGAGRPEHFLALDLGAAPL